MILIEDLKKRHGEEISKEFIDTILNNFFISRHATEEMRLRTSFVNLVVDSTNTYDDGTYIPNYGATIKNIKQAIDKYILAYINTDGSVNIALSDYDYFVFVYLEDKQKWMLKTFKEKSWYGITIQEKHQMAINGFDRQYK